MLTFFRRIRKGLLDTGTARKYLLYAIGEILLVMIGILLALQVNNWNQNRLQQIEVHTSLRQLQNDLKAQLSEINTDIRNHNRALKSSYIILKHLQLYPIFQDSLKSHLFTITQDSYTYNFNATYSEEKFKDLMNESLRLKIQYLYENLIPRVEKGKSLEPDINNYWKDYSTTHFDSHLTNPLFLDNLEIFINEAIREQNRTKVKTLKGYVPLNYQIFREDSEFRVLLNNTITFRANQIIFLNKAQDQIHEILKLIKDELGESE